MTALQALRLPPQFLAVAAAALVGAALVAVAGGDPLAAYGHMISGAFAVSALPDTLAWATPLVGMALAMALPLRAGFVNLGGDGQLVLGGFVAAITAIHLPAGPASAMVALAAAGLAGASLAALSAIGETRLGVPMLISSLLSSYPTIGIVSYLVRFPLRDETTGLPQTHLVPEASRLAQIMGPLSVGLLIIVALASAIFIYDRRSALGYEARMRGLNPEFAAYGGVRLDRQTAGIAAVSGGIAGLVGAIIVLGSQFRFIDEALTTPSYTWSGLMAALLAGGEPIGAATAGFFFAALQTGGFAMQRETSVPRVLAGVMQSLVILFLALRGFAGRGR